MCLQCTFLQTYIPLAGRRGPRSWWTRLVVMSVDLHNFVFVSYILCLLLWLIPIPTRVSDCRLSIVTCLMSLRNFEIQFCIMLHISNDSEPVLGSGRSETANAWNWSRATVRLFVPKCSMISAMFAMTIIFEPATLIKLVGQSDTRQCEKRQRQSKNMIWPKGLVAAVSPVRNSPYRSRMLLVWHHKVEEIRVQPFQLLVRACEHGHPGPHHQ